MWDININKNHAKLSPKTVVKNNMYIISYNMLAKIAETVNCLSYHKNLDLHIKNASITGIDVLHAVV